MWRILLCMLGYHDEFEDRWTEFRSRNGDANGPLRLKVIKREYECIYCEKRSTPQERDSRQIKQDYARLIATAVILLVGVYLVAML